MAPRFPQRKRIFVGCEGESERGYAALLSRLLEQRHRRMHFDSIVLRPGGGDPCGLIETAIRKVRRAESRFGRYHKKVLFLDRDRLGQSTARDTQGLQVAQESGLHLVWQDPCHEALLLRHLTGCEQLRPPTSALALTRLMTFWPDYKKPMSATRLGQRIDVSAVRQAAAVEQALKAFLEDIDFG